jgi:pterin-4a-carbinolamine dehydratase
MAASAATILATLDDAIAQWKRDRASGVIQEYVSFDDFIAAWESMLNDLRVAN